MTTLALGVLTASLLGSLHCAGMCGGFVAFAAGDGARRSAAPLRFHLAYSAGRLVAYAALGALAGAVGAAVDLAAALAGFQRVAAVVAGVVIVAAGTAALLPALGLGAVRIGPPRRAAAALARALAWVGPRPPALRAFLVGLLAACLPCGWLWAFVLTAAATSSALGGAGLMAVFWLGTLPVMMALGVGLHALAAPLRRHVPAACAVAMIVVGLLAVAGRAHPVGEAPRPAAETSHAPAAPRGAGADGHGHHH